MTPLTPQALFALDRVSYEQVCRARATGQGHPVATVFAGLAHLHLPPTPQDPVNVCLTRDGFWESWVTLALARLVRPGMKAWNIGANMGYYAAQMALLGAEVAAWEPNPHARQALERSVEAARDGWGARVTVWPEAFDRHAGTAVFTLPPSTGNGSLCLPPGAGPTVVVETVTLDHEMAQRAPDLIFCDAEFAEERIFLGADFRHHRPILCLEFVPTSFQAPHAFLLFLRECGYVSYLVTTDGGLRQHDLAELVARGAWAQVVFRPEKPAPKPSTRVGPYFI